mgnify:CR=1 FL=1
MTKNVKFRVAGAFGAIGQKNYQSKELATQLYCQNYGTCPSLRICYYYHRKSSWAEVNINEGIYILIVAIFQIMQWLELYFLTSKQ